MGSSISSPIALLPTRVRSDCPHRTLPQSSGSDSQDRDVHGLSRSPALTRSVLGAACPPHFKTIGRLHHCSSRLNFGISREFLSNFANLEDYLRSGAQWSPR